MNTSHKWQIQFALIVIMTFIQFQQKFPTQKSAISYFVNIRYLNGIACPHCASNVKISQRGDRQKLCNCNSCRNTFSVLKGTIFEKSRTDIRIWFYAINIFLNPKNYTHFVVNHSAGQYSAGNGIHTNGIEGFWAVLKRSIIGSYHHVSVKYLQDYVNECCFRQNNSAEGGFDKILRLSIL